MPTVLSSHPPSFVEGGFGEKCLQLQVRRDAGVVWAGGLHSGWKVVMMLGLVAVEGFFPSSGAGPWGNDYIVCWKFWFPRFPPGIFFLGGDGGEDGVPLLCSALFFGGIP